MRPAARRSRDGLTLLEVLVSLAILLLALVALGALVDYGETRAALASMTATGTRLAQSKLAEAEAGVVDCTASGSGNCDDEPGWAWNLDSTAGAATNLFAVTIRVSRDFNGRRFEVTLAQVMMDPNQMGGATLATPPTTATGGGS